MRWCLSYFILYCCCALINSFWNALTCSPSFDMQESHARRTFLIEVLVFGMVCDESPEGLKYRPIETLCLAGGLRM
eukprot:IDg19097t1